MKNRKFYVFKYISFIIVVFLLTMFSGVSEVEAATCEYIVSYTNSSTGKTINSKRLVLETTNYTENAKLSIKYYDKDIYLGGLQINKEKDVTLNGWECPTVAIYSGFKGYYVYESAEQCKKYKSKSACSSTMSGKIVFTSDEEKKARTCTNEEIQAYTSETIPHYAAIEKIDDYKSRLDNIELNGKLSIEIQKDINLVISSYQATIDNTIASIDSIRNKYNCDLTERKNADINDINKLSGVYLDELENYAQSLIDKAVAETTAAGGDTTALENAKDGVSQYVEQVKDEVEEKLKTYIETSSKSDAPTVSDCSVLDDIHELLQTVFDWVKFLAPTLLLLFGSLDFGKAVISNDNDALKKATSNFVKRAIAAVAIFFLPLIVKLLLNIGLGNQIEDAVCGISKVVITWLDI